MSLDLRKKYHEFHEGLISISQFISYYSQDLECIPESQIINKMSSKLLAQLNTKQDIQAFSKTMKDFALHVNEHVLQGLDVDILAGRIYGTALTINVDLDFVAQMKKINGFRKGGLLKQTFMKFVERFPNECNKINQILDYSLDNNFNIIAWRGWEELYLTKDPISLSKEWRDSKKPLICCETPQMVYFRIAMNLALEDEETINIEVLKECYHLLSNQYWVPGSPVLFNSLYRDGNLMSCYLTACHEDSIEEIYKVVGDGAKCFSEGGAVGVSITSLRPKGEPIRGQGPTPGLWAWIKQFEFVSDIVKQAGGKRKGNFTMFIEPWHPEAETILCEGKRFSNNVPKDFHTKQMQYAVWMNDLFMERVQEGKQWTFFSPTECEGLIDAYGDKFKKLYESYEQNPKLIKHQVDAKQFWHRILLSQMETGQPFLMFKDQINRCSNMINFGPVKNSNICTEITQPSAPNLIANCNVSTMNCSKYITNDRTFDCDKFVEHCKKAMRLANRIIDVNFYGVPSSKDCALIQRATAIGLIGLNTALNKLRVPYKSEEGRQFNRLISEALYYGTTYESCMLAKKYGPHPMYEGTQTEQGVHHYQHFKDVKFSGKFDWVELEQLIQKYGIRNGYRIGYPPTASVSALCGVSETTQPYLGIVYTKTFQHGRYAILNKYALKHLKEINLMNDHNINEVLEEILQNDGTLSSLTHPNSSWKLPKEIWDIYRTAYEIPADLMIDYAADRQPFVDQSQSLNLFIKNPSAKLLDKLHMKSFKRGLKTAVYYLETPPTTKGIKITSQKRKQLEVDEDDSKKYKMTDSDNSIGSVSSSQENLVEYNKEIIHDETSRDSCVMLFGGGGCS